MKNKSESQKRREAQRARIHRHLSTQKAIKAAAKKKAAKGKESK